MATVDLDITFLGTGTSTGVPMLGCRCEACRSSDPRDCRWRASLLLRWRRTTVVIDTTPEFRLQLLRAGVESLSAVLLTHNHADHVHGLDDVRPFCFGKPDPVPLYGNPATMQWVRRHFAYVWEAEQAGGGLPKLDLRPVDGAFAIDGLGIVPVPVWHGRLLIYGYRIGTLAYLSDVSAIPDTSFGLLAGLDTLIIDAVRYRPHPTHFHLAAAIAAARRIGARQTYLTHLNHDFLHQRLAAELPDDIRPAYDGLALRATAVLDPADPQKL